MLAACAGKSIESGDDQAPVSNAPTDPPSSDVEAAPVATTPPADPTPAAAPAVDTTPPSSVDAAAPGAASFGPTSEMAVSFSYIPTDGGRVLNPYLAVWLEDAAGVPVRTLNVTMQSGRKGEKYVRDLRRWFTNDQARISAGGSDILEAVTSPTRLPGATDLVWDGRNDAGEFVATGSYYLCIEAARERGPYDLIREELAFTGEPFEQQLADSGDLQQVTVSVRPVS
jgi:hypothetical protein